MKYLVVGLGNPGPEYELTRHNIGFLVLDQLAGQFDKTFMPGRLASKTEIKHKGRTIHIIKPSTYMNLSGKAVNYWMKELKIPRENLLIVVDDIALPFGALRMRAKGSDAGHNGLKDIQMVLGGANYPRLKFGIDDNFGKGQQVNYVLSQFSSEEIVQLPDIFKRSTDMILSFCTIGIQRTMNQYND